MSARKEREKKLSSTPIHSICFRTLKVVESCREYFSFGTTSVQADPIWSNFVGNITNQ